MFPVLATVSPVSSVKQWNVSAAIFSDNKFRQLTSDLLSFGHSLIVLNYGKAT